MFSPRKKAFRGWDPGRPFYFAFEKEPLGNPLLAGRSRDEAGARILEDDIRTQVGHALWAPARVAEYACPFLNHYLDATPFLELLTAKQNIHHD